MKMVNKDHPLSNCIQIHNFFQFKNLKNLEESETSKYMYSGILLVREWQSFQVCIEWKRRTKSVPVTANVPPRTAQSRVMKWPKLRLFSLIVTTIGDKS